MNFKWHDDEKSKLNVHEKNGVIWLSFPNLDREDWLNAVFSTRIGGDRKSVSIAAASIVAKVTRDRMMVEYDEMFPGYAFAKNKGYGTAEHIAALREFGPCPIHRRTFITKFVSEDQL